MAIDWQKIIKDKAKYKDDAEITIAGEKYTLAELREADAASHGELTKQLQADQQRLEADRKQLATAQVEVANLFQKFSEVTGASIEDIVAGKVKLSKSQAAASAAAATGLDENDPILAPVIKAMTELKTTNESELSTVKAELAKTQKALGQALQANLEDHYNREFDSVKANMPKAVKDLTVDKVMEHAKANNFMDKHGRFNIRKAFDDLTAEARVAERIEAAKEEGMKLGRESAAMATVQRPGLNRHTVEATHKNADGSTKTIEQALNDALNDSEILKSISVNAGAA